MHEELGKIGRNKKKEKAQTNNDMNDKKKHSVESVGEDGGRGITRLSGRWRFEIFRIWGGKDSKAIPDKNQPSILVLVFSFRLVQVRVVVAAKLRTGCQFNVIL